MPYVPPWETPPDFLRAAEMGAQIGLHQADTASEAALKRGQMGLEDIMQQRQLGMEGQRISSEQARALADQKLANARLLTQQNHYEDLNQLGQERLGQGDQRLGQGDQRLGQGDQRLAEQQAKDKSAQELANSRLGLSQDRLNALTKYHQDLLDARSEAEKLKQGKVDTTQRANQDYIEWVNDPAFQTDPTGSLKRHPLATETKAGQDLLNKFDATLYPHQNSGGGATITYFTPAGAIRDKLPESAVARLAGTNYQGSANSTASSAASALRPTMAAPAARPAAPVVKKGTVAKGYIYIGDDSDKGGDPTKKENWIPVTGQ